ncbi:MAG TPA: helix-turn-helix transcriptional regulator [Gemmatimonadaceae bacterium]|nr:helix-turn-helix transcriptional regulator [Gemmatimonadaceae bacterium]
MQALGRMLREWRAVRHQSQLALALKAEVSQRHLSFVESGRANPSRELVLKIAAALDLPLRARNHLLAAAGYAAVYPERQLDATAMRTAREALERILAHQEPYPAMVLDRSWNMVMRNAANERIVSRCVSASSLAALAPHGQLNFLRLMFSPNGMRPRIRSWQTTASYLMARLRREAAAGPGSPSDDLLRELAPHAPPIHIASDDVPMMATAPLEIQLDDGAVLRLFNTLTTFGTPQDVTLDELRVEMSFPADAASEALLRRWASL